LRGWKNREICIGNVDKPDELLAHILDVAAGKKKCDYQLRRKARDLRTRISKFTEDDLGIFEHLI
jgi:hypothetical protein